MGQARQAVRAIKANTNARGDYQNSARFQERRNRADAIHVLLIDLSVPLNEALDVHEEGPADHHKNGVQMNGREVVGTLAVSGQSGHHLIAK